MHVHPRGMFVCYDIALGGHNCDTVRHSGPGLGVSISVSIVHSAVIRSDLNLKRPAKPMVSAMGLRHD